MKNGPVLRGGARRCPTTASVQPKGHNTSYKYGLSEIVCLSPKRTVATKFSLLSPNCFRQMRDDSPTPWCAAEICDYWFHTSPST